MRPPFFISNHRKTNLLIYIKNTRKIWQKKNKILTLPVRKSKKENHPAIKQQTFKNAQ